MVAESIFNSKLRYGIALYLNPVYEKEDVKARTLTTEARKLQVIQNDMLRMAFGYKPQDMMNMEKLRKEIGMFSVNQMNMYHVYIETFNIINYGSSNKIQEKWMPDEPRVYSNRRKFDVKIPRVKHTKCRGFSLHGAVMWNKLPENIKSIKNPDVFKEEVKDFIWETIPSY